MQYLYESIFYSEKVNSLFSNESMVDAMLRFEAALANAAAKHGVIPAQAGASIARNCALEKINMAQLIADGALGGNPAIPLVKQLTIAVRQESADAAKFVHFGATSQDVMDSAFMLQLREATALIAADLDLLIEQLILLTKTHRKTWMVGRSFMQHARPISFGFKTAGWLDALLRSGKALRSSLADSFVLQLGGAVGTLSFTNEKGLGLLETMGKELGLKAPARPWHTQRDRFASIATTFGILSGNIGKMAKDISLLAQTEIGELSERSEKGKAGSSTMPHKVNPLGSIIILANTARVPAMVSTMLSTMIQDHERATGLWHAEWETLAGITELAGGTMQMAVDLIRGLEIHADRMASNLELTRGLIYAENLAFALAPFIGKAEAHELVEQCCRDAQSKGLHLKEICTSQPIISKHLNKDQIDKIFDPAHSLGLFDVFIDRVLNSNN